MSYKGSQYRNRKLKKLYNVFGDRCISAVWYDEEKKRYIRMYRGSRSKYLKKLSNKKLRRTKNIASGKGGYRRSFDFWWELY